MPRALNEVVFVDGVRTPFGKAGDKGMYAQTRADDLVIRCIRELLHRNPNLPKDKVEEVAIAATATSSMRSAGRSGWRRISSRMHLMTRSSARVSAYWPLALPNGVRTPSTKTTSRWGRDTGAPEIGGHGWRHVTPE